MSSFDLKILTAQPNLAFMDEEKRVLETILPVILPFGPEQAVPLGLLRFGLDKTTAEAYFNAGIASLEEMTAPPNIEIATNLDGVERAAKGMDDLRNGNGG